MRSRLEHKSTDVGYTSIGFNAAVFWCLYKCASLRNAPTKYDVIECLIFIFYFIAQQNRSTLIGIIPIFVYSIIKLRSRYRIMYLFFLTIILISVLPFMKNIYASLVNETEIQLSDEKYNRWQSLSFYLFEMKTNIFNYILGNGMWSRSGEYLNIMVNAQESRGTFISDLGLLGTFYYYGILPIFIMYRFCIIAIKRCPLYLKYYAVFIIVVPTIQSFLLLNTSTNILFCIFFYLVIYTERYHNDKSIINL